MTSYFRVQTVPMGNVKGLSANTPGSAMLLLKLVSVAVTNRRKPGLCRYSSRGRAVMAAPRRSDDSEHRHDQPRRDTQGPGDGVIAPAAPVEAHGDEEAGDGEEAVHRMLAKGEARGDRQRLVRDDARRDAEGMGHDDGERESEPDRGEVVPVPCQG